MQLDRLLRRYPGYTLGSLMGESTAVIAVARAGIEDEAERAAGES